MKTSIYLVSKSIKYSTYSAGTSSYILKPFPSTSIPHHNRRTMASATSFYDFKPLDSPSPFPLLLS